MTDDFWGNTEKPQDGNYESAGGDFEPIPANTEVLATPDEMTWKNYEGTDYINIKWSVLAPEQYKDRVIFQKLYPLGNHPNNKDPKAKGEKDKAMLAAIDMNASGGKLFELGRKPEDIDFAGMIVASQMLLKLQVWKMGEGADAKSGNWISKVAPKGIPQAAPEPVKGPTDGADDDIPTGRLVGASAPFLGESNGYDKPKTRYTRVVQSTQE